MPSDEINQEPLPTDDPELHYLTIAVTTRPIVPAMSSRSASRYRTHFATAEWVAWELMSRRLVGTVVSYVLPHGPRAGERRPAMIIRVLDRTAGRVSLNVFADDADNLAAISVDSCYSSLDRPGSWMDNLEPLPLPPDLPAQVYDRVP